MNVMDVFNTIKYKQHIMVIGETNSSYSKIIYNGLYSDIEKWPTLRNIAITLYTVTSITSEENILKIFI